MKIVIIIIITIKKLLIIITIDINVVRKTGWGNMKKSIYESIIYKKIIMNRFKKKGKSIAMLSQYAYTVTFCRTYIVPFLWHMYGKIDCHWVTVY
jgi:hypothetical protein